MLNHLTRVLFAKLLAPAMLGIGICLMPFLAHAQATNQSAWPQKPIRWIIPYTPGGLTDTVTRIVIQKVQENTGWSIVMENRPGANSLLGAELVARSSVRADDQLRPHVGAGMPAPHLERAGGNEFIVVEVGMNTEDLHETIAAWSIQVPDDWQIGRAHV